MLKHVKFFDTSVWAEHKSYLPQFEVESGEIKEVPTDISEEIASIAVEAEKAEWVDIKTNDDKLKTQAEKLKIARDAAKVEGDTIREQAEAEETARKQAEALSNPGKKKGKKR